MTPAATTASPLNLAATERKTTLAPPQRKTAPRCWEPTFLVNRTLSRHIREAAQRWFSIDATPRILDVGCGSMPYRSFFAARCREYVGCDFFPASHEIVRCPADALAFEDASCDAVVCFQVLEHVRRPWQVVRECARVTRPGGLVMLSAPFLFPHHSSPDDYFRFTHQGFVALAEEAGLEVQAVTAQCSSLTTLCLILNWYVARVQNRFRRRALAKPLTFLIAAGVIVPLNLAGMFLDARPFRRAATAPNEGFSNFLVVCRKPSRPAPT